MCSTIPMATLKLFITTTERHRLYPGLTTTGHTIHGPTTHGIAHGAGASMSGPSVSDGTVGGTGVPHGVGDGTGVRRGPGEAQAGVVPGGDIPGVQAGGIQVGGDLIQDQWQLTAPAVELPSEANTQWQQTVPTEISTVRIPQVHRTRFMA